MATTFLDIIFVLFWPVILSAAAWAIAIDALAETHKNSDVVEALTRPTGIQRNAKRQDVTLRPSHFRLNASGNKNFFQVQFGRKEHMARRLLRAKGRAKARGLRREDDRLRNHAAVVRRPHGNSHTETVSP